MKRAVFDPGRISALSDGVFAIAMTLLVLDLKAPDFGAGNEPGQFAASLMEQGPSFLSWLLSFAILCRLWIIQHDLLAGGDTRSRGFLAWNFLFLGCVALIPFPTSLLAEHPDKALSVIVFSTVFATAGVALAFMRRAFSAGEETGTERRRPMSRSAALLLATAATSCLVAVFHPSLGALVWFSYPITAAEIRRRDQRSGGQQTYEA